MEGETQVEIPPLPIRDEDQTQGYQDISGESYNYEDVNPNIVSWVQAIWDYEAQGEGELSFTAGQYIGVLEPGEGWSKGELRDTKVQGYFPVNYVVEYVPEATNQEQQEQQQTQEGEQTYQTETPIEPQAQEVQ